MTEVYQLIKHHLTINTKTTALNKENYSL